MRFVSGRRLCVRDQLLGFIGVQSQTDFVWFFVHPFSFLPPVSGILGVRVLPASAVLISNGDACAFLAQQEKPKTQPESHATVSYTAYNLAFLHVEFRSCYISRYAGSKFDFLPFVVASIVAMVFSYAVFAARTPAMGNSADRAWQLSQLVEGVSTAFNPSRGSLSYVQAGHCVSKQIGRHDAACQGCPRCVFLARRKLAASGSSRAPCAFPNLRCDPRCWLFSCLGL